MLSGTEISTEVMSGINFHLYSLAMKGLWQTVVQRLSKKSIFGALNWQLLKLMNLQARRCIFLLTPSASSFLWEQHDQEDIVWAMGGYGGRNYSCVPDSLTESL